MTKEKLMELTLVQLKEKAVEVGLSEEVVKTLTTKSQIIGIINVFDTKKEEDKLVDRTKSAVETPKEKLTSDKAWLSKQATMGRHLESQPKVGIAIQLEVGEKEGIVESKVVNGIREFKVISGSVKEKIVNGYKWIMPKGVMTMVPQQIYELVSNELNIMAKIGSKQSIDRLDPNTGKPVRDALS